MGRELTAGELAAVISDEYDLWPVMASIEGRWFVVTEVRADEDRLLLTMDPLE